jgi:predicted CXXCH cytochrome family protein
MQVIPEANRHKPVREGECTVCHQVHGSGKESLLKPVEGSGLCTSCHQQMMGGHHLLEASEIEGKSGVDLTGKNLCAACHHPHASSGRSLLRSSDNEICRGCHGM